MGSENTDGWKLPWDGGCRCGETRFRVTLPPLFSSACHCTGCQKMSASAYSLTLILPKDALQVTKGETVIGGLHGASQHHFCPRCKSWMFTRPEGMADQIVNLRPTMLDDPSWFVPYAETWTQEKLPWATTPAVHSYASLPPMDAYEPLMREFAERSPRPKKQAAARGRV